MTSIFTPSHYWYIGSKTFHRRSTRLSVLFCLLLCCLNQCQDVARELHLYAYNNHVFFRFHTLLFLLWLL